MAGKAKVFGTILGIGGAMVFTFVKGPSLHWDTGINLLEITSPHFQANAHKHGSHDLVIGLVLAFASVVCYSVWLIIQVSIGNHRNIRRPYLQAFCQ